MKILACFTVAPDFDTFSQNDWANLTDPHQTFSMRKQAWGGFDEGALEWALRLRDGETAVTALTVSHEEHDDFIKTLLALPFDRVARVDRDTAHDPEKTAALIAGFVRACGGFDLILMSAQGSIGGSSLVPSLTAAELNFSCVRNVTELEVKNGAVRLRRSVDGEKLEQVYSFPLVAAVGNSYVSYLRVPTLRDRLAASQKSAEIFPAEAFSSCGSQRRRELVSLKHEVSARECRMIEGRTAAEKAKRLYDLLKMLPDLRARTPQEPDIFDTCAEMGERVLLFDSGDRGDEQAVLTSWHTGGTVCLGVKRVYAEGGEFFAERSVYSGNMTGTFRLLTPPFCLSPQKSGVASAEILLAVGRGVGSAAAVKALQPLAERLGAEIVGSRAAVMNGWVEQAGLIGISGKAVSPRVCIAVGISGAAAFCAGIENSGMIIAINHDLNAPIFALADIGIVDDYRIILSALDEILSADT